MKLIDGLQNFSLWKVITDFYFIFFQRKVDLRRHKETQHTDIRTLPQSQTASTRPPPVSSAMSVHGPPPHFMSALHRAHFLPPPPPLLQGLPHLPLPQGLPPPPTSLAFPLGPLAPPSLAHDLSRPRGPTAATLT